MTFKFKYRKSSPWPKPWRTVEVAGFAYDAALNRCLLFLPNDQGRLELAPWDSYEAKLGQDWLSFEKQTAKDLNRFNPHQKR